MSPGRPDAELADVLVEGDRITAIGERIERPDAEVVDVTGRIIIPGLVNAHLHTWQGPLRCVGADWTLGDDLPRGGVTPGLRRVVVRQLIGQRLPRETRLSRSTDGSV